MELLGDFCATANDLHDCVLFLWRLDASLIHQIGYARFQLIDTLAHIIDACDNLIRHRLKFVLHILQ